MPPLSCQERGGAEGRAPGRSSVKPPHLASRSRRSGCSRCRQPSAAPAAPSCCCRGPSSLLGARRSPGRMRNWGAAPARRCRAEPPLQAASCGGRRGGRTARPRAKARGGNGSRGAAWHRGGAKQNPWRETQCRARDWHIQLKMSLAQGKANAKQPETWYSV